uniref:Uncharacterized protein n=1 Tax=Leersia perrieri TaxID=77586 RepID=A0A0D9W2R5_9ORYZ
MGYINWPKIEAYNNPMFTAVADLCKERELYDIMALQSDWCDEIIAQFWTILYFYSTEDGTPSIKRRSNGDDYQATIDTFARVLNLDPKADLLKHHLHVHGLLPHYNILNKLFRYSIGTKGGDSSTIQGFSWDLLYYCRSRKPKISIMYYIWDEMQLTANDAQRAPVYAPYIQLLIDEVVPHAFIKDRVHSPYAPRNQTFRSSSLAPSGSCAPSSTHAPTSRLSSSSSSSSPIRRFLKAIFSMCTVNATSIHENAVKIRKIENRQKAFLRSQHVDVSNDDTSEIPPPCFQDPFGDDGAGSSAAGSSAARGSRSHFFGFDPSTAFHENSGVTDAAYQGEESSEEFDDAEESDDDRKSSY